MTAALLEPETLELETMPANLTPTRLIAPAGIHRIVLTGFMGSGKTTIGGLLAQHLNWRFVDLDHEIERREALSGTPRTVPEIFAQSGEAHFRHLESAALAALLGQRNIVLALGGGAPEDLGNRLLLEQTPHTSIVYLTAPLQTLLDRCNSQPNATARPVLTEAATRFQLRHPLYQRIAHHTLDTTTTPLPQTPKAILTALHRKP